MKTHEAEKKVLLQENELNRQKVKIKEGEFVRNLFITIGVAFILISIFIYRNYKQKKDSEALLQVQKDALQSKNDYIIASINYAKRIQDALLKTQEYVSKHLPPHFILFQPKDIVSGDFYWALEKENHLYIAAVDCTGHGVPGGFLTMLGASFLNEINSVNQLLSPAKILNKLRVKVVAELSSDGKTKDGMDISLLRLNLKNNKAEWAGANNPIYIIKQNASEVEIIKGDREPIGFTDKFTDFTNHELQLASGDGVFLFTDGFADQFGGDKNRKFGYKNFRELLVKINGKNVDDQKKELISSFSSWKGGGDQIDDVCVIGLKIS